MIFSIFHTRYVIIPILIVLYVFWTIHSFKEIKSKDESTHWTTGAYVIIHLIIFVALAIWGLIISIPWIVTNW